VKRVKGVCPFCGGGHVTQLDGSKFSCSRGHYWRIEDDGVEKLHRLTIAEASVKMAMVDVQRLLEVEQLNKTNTFKEKIVFPPEALQVLRQGILGLVRDGELMVLLTPDEEIIYALIDEEPYPLRMQTHAQTDGI